MKTPVRSGLLAAALLAALPTWADTQSLKSDADTLGAATALDIALLNSGDVTGLTFAPVAVGGFGTFTPVPPGAPTDTQVVNIAPGNGSSGFFRIDFVLPVGVSTVSIAGAANADDIGRVFVNGHALTPELNQPGQVTEFDNVTFASSDQSFFHAGMNTLVVADANTGGGPSGAAFFATVDFAAPVPEPASWLLLGGGLVGLSVRRGKLS